MPTTTRQRNEYRSALRSKKYIKMALSELLQTKDFDEITVTELVKIAKVNRGTFYAHYKNLVEVLDDIEKEIADQIILSFMSYRETLVENPMLFLGNIANILKRDFAFYKRLVCTNGGMRFIDRLKEMFITAVLDSEEDTKLSKKANNTFAILVRFYTNGFANMYEDFFKGRLNITIDKLTKTIADIISTGFEGYIG